MADAFAQLRKAVLLRMEHVDVAPEMFGRPYQGGMATGGDVVYDWGGGLIWAALPPKPDAQAALLRARVNAAGGHATLIRAPEQVRRNIDVFHPQQDGLAKLSERVRHGFDPKNILNRGRMIRGAAT